MFTDEELEIMWQAFTVPGGVHLRSILHEVRQYTGLSAGELAQIIDYFKSRAGDRSIEKGRRFREQHPDYYKEYLRMWRRSRKE